LLSLPLAVTMAGLGSLTPGDISTGDMIAGDAETVFVDGTPCALLKVISARSKLGWGGEAARWLSNRAKGRRGQGRLVDRAID
jgi:hypothetical protein